VRLREIGLLLISLGAASQTAQGDVDTHFQEGQSLAQEGLAGAVPQDKFFEKNQIEVKERDLDKKELGALNQEAVMGSLQGQFRWYEQDRLIAQSDAVVANPEGAIWGSVEEEDTGPSELKTCVEPREVHTVTRREVFVIDDLKYVSAVHMPARYELQRRGGSNEFGDKLQDVYWENVMVAPAYTIPAKVEIAKSHWESDGEGMAALEKDGTCKKMSRTCLDAAPRPLEVAPGIVMEVTPPEKCWTTETVYQCGGLGQEDTCKALREQGCTQVSTKPHKKVGDIVVSYEQTLECNPKRVAVKAGQQGLTPFCLDGDCAKMDIAPNEDMAEALSKLAMMSELSKQMDTKSMTAFSGSSQSCRKAALGFLSCCDGEKGWGSALGSHCKEEEKRLIEWRKQHKCHEVGTYCVERAPLTKICLRKKRVYCCFPTRMAAAVQIAGRAQLGKGWGTPEAPQCQGLTIEEITQIDWGKVDLSAVFRDQYQQTLKSVDPTKVMDHMKQTVQSRLPTSPSSKPTPSFKEGRHGF
jgi:hypothetical protein